MSGVPNKPMVPTAPTPPDENSFGPLRRHIGQPFDGVSEYVSVDVADRTASGAIGDTVEEDVRGHFSPPALSENGQEHLTRRNG